MIVSQQANWDLLVLVCECSIGAMSPHTFLAILLRGCFTKVCVLVSRNVTVGRDKEVADAVLLLLLLMHASALRPWNKRGVLCFQKKKINKYTFIQSFIDLILGDFISIVTFLWPLPLVVVFISKTYVTVLWLTVFCVAPVWVPYILHWGSCHRLVWSFWHQSTCLCPTICAWLSPNVGRADAQCSFDSIDT